MRRPSRFQGSFSFENLARLRAFDYIVSQEFVETDARKPFSALNPELNA
jgi:hypothetical protein